MFVYFTVKKKITFNRYLLGKFPHANLYAGGTAASELPLAVCLIGIDLGDERCAYHSTTKI